MNHSLLKGIKAYVYPEALQHLACPPSTSVSTLRHATQSTPPPPARGSHTSPAPCHTPHPPAPRHHAFHTSSMHPPSAADLDFFVSFRSEAFPSRVYQRRGVGRGAARGAGVRVCPAAASSYVFLTLSLMTLSSVPHAAHPCDHTMLALSTPPRPLHTRHDFYSTTSPRPSLTPTLPHTPCYLPPPYPIPARYDSSLSLTPSTSLTLALPYLFTCLLAQSLVPMLAHHHNCTPLPTSLTCLHLP